MLHYGIAYVDFVRATPYCTSIFAALDCYIHNQEQALPEAFRSAANVSRMSVIKLSPVYPMVALLFR